MIAVKRSDFRYRLQQSYQRSSLVKQLVNSSTHCNLSYFSIIFMRITGSKVDAGSKFAEGKMVAPGDVTALLEAVVPQVEPVELARSQKILSSKRFQRIRAAFSWQWG